MRFSQSFLSLWFEVYCCFWSFRYFWYFRYLDCLSAWVVVVCFGAHQLHPSFISFYVFLLIRGDCFEKFHFLLFYLSLFDFSFSHLSYNFLIDEAIIVVGGNWEEKVLAILFLVPFSFDGRFV